MGSTNSTTPPYKVILIVISVVVSLHLLTAMAIVMIEPTTPNREEKVMPVIEIQLATPVTDIENTKSIVEKAEVKPVKKVLEAAQQPKVANKPKAVATNQSLVAKSIKNIKPKADSKAKTQQVARKEKTTQKQLDRKVDSADLNKNTNLQAEQKAAQQAERRANEQRSILAIQAQQREAELAELETQKVAQAQRDAQAAINAQATKDAAEKAARAAEEAEAEAKKATSNMPVNFTANSASWASTPIFSFPSRAERGTRSGDSFTVILVLRVNKQGAIESVTVAKSSGNREIDRAAKEQVTRGKFKPFTKDGAARVGNVTLPIAYQVP